MTTETSIPSLSIDVAGSSGAIADALAAVAIRLIDHTWSPGFSPLVVEGGANDQIGVTLQSRQSGIPQFSPADVVDGLRRREFELFIQPQVVLGTGAIRGGEALLRWRHPQFGVISPAAFLTAIEKSGLAAEFGAWILGEACRIAARTNSLGGCIRIGANLFSEQLYDTKLHSQVLNALDASGLAPELLELEITETTVLHFDGMVISQLKRIRSLGVGIAFDDYGTGFASLSMLKRYPLSRLKIDREFIQNIHRDASDVAIVQAVLCLGQKLDFEVIAEGMETRQQVDALIRLGCVHGQGYFFGMPMPAPQFEALAQAQIRSMTEDAAA